MRYPRLQANKYGNRKILVDGIMFDSAKEARRYAELLLLEKSGEISNIERQVRYILVPAQKGEDGKVIERQMSYVADFRYTDKNGHTVVEDVKGMKTEVYKLKKKLMLYFHGIEVKEV